MYRTLTMVAVVLVATSDPPRVHAGTAAGDDSVVFVGAGDIANCEILGGARATASLLDQIDGAIFTLGDHAYQHGSDKEFRDCYEPTWGRHKARTHPTVGNHDMITDHGRPSFKYFGDAAGPDERGYYSFDLGARHIISLNSFIDAGGHSPQVKWRRDDLAAQQTTDCVLADCPAARFTAAAHGVDPAT